MSELNPGATLADLQDYCQRHFKERGFGVGDDEPGRRATINHELLLLTEEVGELAKAVRKSVGMTTDANSQIGEIQHELADCLWVITSLANLHGIELEQAFRDKEAINHRRTWS